MYPETVFVNAVFVARWMILHWLFGVNSTVLVDVLISIKLGVGDRSDFWIYLASALMFYNSNLVINSRISSAIQTETWIYTFFEKWLMHIVPIPYACVSAGFKEVCF